MESLPLLPWQMAVHTAVVPENDSAGLATTARISAACTVCANKMQSSSGARTEVIFLFTKIPPFVIIRPVFPSYQVNAAEGGFLTSFFKNFLFGGFRQRYALCYVQNISSAVESTDVKTYV